MIKQYIEDSEKELKQWTVPAQECVNLLPSDFCTICGCNPKRLEYWHRSQMEGLVKKVVEMTEGMKTEIFELKYEPSFREDYKIKAHEQTLRIGYNRALEDLKTKLLEELK